MEENNYETQTNLLNCEDMISYLWSKCDKYSLPFKPENAKSIQTEVELADEVCGEEIRNHYLFGKEDLKHANIQKKEEYDVDTVDFKTLDEKGNELSQGTLLLMHKHDHKYYGLFLLEEKEDGSHLKLLVKASQKKKLFDSFDTSVVLFY